MSGQQRSVDEAFRCLSHSRRRQLLLALWEASRSSDGRAARVAVDEAVDDGGARTRIELVHCHLPKLEANGYVRWHEDADTVEPGPEWESVEPLLALLADHRADLLLDRDACG